VIDRSTSRFPGRAAPHYLDYDDDYDNDSDPGLTFDWNNNG
jgi:hypothetical protein